MTKRLMNQVTRYLVAIVAVAMLTGCGLRESFKDVSAETGRFHAALNAGRWEPVWKAADPQLRQATSRDQFARLFAAVHRKLGRVQSAKEVGWNANADTGGTFLTVTMETRFERGAGTERFVYRKIADHRLALAAYNIESQDMMLN